MALLVVVVLLAIHLDVCSLFVSASFRGGRKSAYLDQVPKLTTIISSALQPQPDALQGPRQLAEALIALPLNQGQGILGEAQQGHVPDVVLVSRLPLQCVVLSESRLTDNQASKSTPYGKAAKR